jgi:hypothetical protein
MAAVHPHRPCLAPDSRASAAEAAVGSYRDIRRRLATASEKSEEQKALWQSLRASRRLGEREGMRVVIHAHSILGNVQVTHDMAAGASIMKHGREPSRRVHRPPDRSDLFISHETFKPSRWTWG